MSHQERSYGRRLLPQVLDDLSSRTPERLYATIPCLQNDLSQGFRTLTVKDVAHCVDALAWWLQENLGHSDSFETLSYIEIPDIRGAITFLAAIKCGYKVLLPSPRNPATTNKSLFDQTACTKLVHADEVSPVVNQLTAIHSELEPIKIASIEELLSKTARQYPYQKSFDEARDDPIVVLHSSGSTGLPKPVTMTHGSFAVLDRERNLPTIPGRKNRDFSIWDFGPDGGKFYTVFPYFHLAGFLSTVINPILTEASSPVLGPALMPPSAALMEEVMKHQKLRALYIPPSIAEQVLQEPNGLDLFRGLDFVCYTGGPFSQKAGEVLAQVTELLPLYGSTEAFQVPQLAPQDPLKDYAYMEWNPVFKLDMQPSDDEPGAFELVLFADADTENMSALNQNFPGIHEWRTKDLFKQHPDPQKPNLWSYYGRRDDTIVLSNSEKFNPVPMELIIQGHPKLAGALITGKGRRQAALLVEPKTHVIDKETL